MRAAGDVPVTAKVRIGIDAPAHVQVHRQEVYLEVQRATLEAASASRCAMCSAAAATPHAVPTHRRPPALPDAQHMAEKGRCPPPSLCVPAGAMRRHAM